MFRNYFKKFLGVFTFAFVFGCGNYAYALDDSDSCAVVVFSPNGHTRNIAKTIAEYLNAPLMEIQPKDAYTSEDLNYRVDNSRAVKESQDAKIRPEIRNELRQVLKYDNIFIGSPIWFRKNPRIIQTFLDTYNLKNKNLYFFVTSGGTPIYHYMEAIKSYYPDLNIKDSKRFRQDESKGMIVRWVEDL